MKLPDLEAWAIFARVAELGSFASTAEALGITQPTVSKAIARLEKRIGTPLLHRTSRRMTLTAAGEAAVERASRLLADGEAVEAAVTAQAISPRGHVRMAAPMSFGVAHVAPLLPAFMTKFPDVTLELALSDETVDIVGGGFDLALRIGTLEDSSLVARRLCGVRILLVGAPAYFERFGRPKHPRDLGTQRGLTYAYARSGAAWRFHHARHGDYSVGVPSVLRANNAEALTPALLAGMGLALQPEFLVWRELRRGALEVALPGWQPPEIAVHVVMPPGRSRPARVQALVDHLARKLAQAPWASGE